MVYFVSDVHLGLGSREARRLREERFINFLQKLTDTCEVLYIVGDLFDYWFEYSTVIPREFFRTLTALEQVRKRGIRIEYLIGNHDFGHQDFFRTELGIDIYADDIVREHSGKKFYIAHGDGKVYNDTGYLILRAILRNRINIKLYQWLHPDVGIRLASNTSVKSRAHTDARQDGKRDGLSDFAAARIADGFDYVIMGHRHEPLFREFGNEQHRGIYLNLGDWLHHNTFGSFDGSELRLEKVDDFVAP